MKQVHRPESVTGYGRDCDRGAVIVEFALVLPLLILILLTVADLGLVVHEHQVLQNAVREAARFSALPTQQVLGSGGPVTLDQVRQRVVDYCARENIQVLMTDISVDQETAIETQNGLVLRASRVHVEYVRPFRIGGTSMLPVGETRLTATAVFRNLY